MADHPAPGHPTAAARPLSPHLQIYRWSWTMAMSIAHRATGVALYFGTLLLALWLVAAASGEWSFGWAQWLAGSLLGRLVLFAYTYALFHHMVGGIRHFVWDFGKGFDPETRMNMARFTPVAAIILTVLAWAAGYALR
ncbi:MAG: succinate dehydrogenase, cytochrome b556 subunit [Beijerinckiaceae bacterium]